MAIEDHIPSAEGASPVMAQWFAIKAQYPHALVFFRMGDFYELFFADAEAAAAALDIALTSRGEHAGKPIPMCGVPASNAEPYLVRLIRRGFRVAVAEQMDDSKAVRARGSKALISREVVRLITPGTLTEEALLDATRPNLLLAFAQSESEIGAAYVDISIGSLETETVAPETLPALLARLEPAEILAPETIPLGEWDAYRAPHFTALPSPARARQSVAEAFGVASLEAFGEFSDGEAVALAMVLAYVRATQAGAIPRLAPPRPQGKTGRMGIDAATRANLEITRARDGTTTHTLLSAVQRTLTSAGARLLAEWLSGPLTDRDAIIARHDGWAWFAANAATANRVRQQLRASPDMARALGRLSLRRSGPRDLAAIREGLRIAEALSAILHEPLPPVLAEAAAALSGHTELYHLLRASLARELPLRLDEGGVIAPGFDAELDAERRLRDEARQILAALQATYAERYEVPNLKIRHHAQFGYVMEVPAQAVERLRRNPDLILRQSMANSARFVSSELVELDRRIAEAAERAQHRERAVFEAVVAQVLAKADALAKAAEALALLDVLQSAAGLAESGKWCRPEISTDYAFHIEAGRHPVVEAALAGRGTFIPNDCNLGPDRRVLLLTGPNMAGKSTYLRQNALAVILAQAGLPVPARRACIGIVDRLFSRVGASDDLARGRSTFMVEMTETAAILNQAGPRSLVVVDEVGRGTGTLDGLAIAWSVLEALHGQVRARTIFATHFHELARLQAELPFLSPHTMRVKEWKGEVVFLHEVVPGAAGRSWGVHVARLAGVPQSVVRRAAALLDILEKRGAELMAEAELPLFARSHERSAPEQDPPPSAAVLAALAALNPDQMTPREALEAIYQLRALLPGKAEAEGVDILS